MGRSITTQQIFKETNKLPTEKGEKSKEHVSGLRKDVIGIVLPVKR